MNEPQNAAPQNAQIHAQLGRKYDAGFITAIESESLALDAKIRAAYSRWEELESKRCALEEM